MAIFRDDVPRCPMDGGRMRLLIENGRGGIHRLRLFWCASCQLGTAVLGDGQSAARNALFSADAKTRTLVVRGGEKMRQAVADFAATRPEIVERLLPPPDDVSDLLQWSS